jgi:hypothetical protein
MRNLKKFETEADVRMFVQPNIILIKNTKEVKYNADTFGVFIQHIDGSLYTIDEWTTGEYAKTEANGVMVSSESCKFVIAKKNVSYEKGLPAWGDEVLVEGVMATTSSTIAFTDLEGEANTYKIVERITGDNCSARQCMLYVFPNGANGYLPSLGEWAEAYQYKEDIDAAMTLIGGDVIDSSWSSTQYDETSAWRFYWSNGETDYSYYTKRYTGYFYARPFTKLIIP